MDDNIRYFLDMLGCLVSGAVLFGIIFCFEEQSDVTIVLLCIELVISLLKMIYHMCE